jgi:hypothetical protein
MNNEAAYGRSEPGTGPTPVFDDPGDNLAIKNGWRRDPPGIVEDINETYEEIMAKQIDLDDPYWQAN